MVKEIIKHLYIILQRGIDHSIQKSKPIGHDFVTRSKNLNCPQSHLGGRLRITMRNNPIHDAHGSPVFD